MAIMAIIIIPLGELTFLLQGIFAIRHKNLM